MTIHLVNVLSPKLILQEPLSVSLLKSIIVNSTQLLENATNVKPVS